MINSNNGEPLFIEDDLSPLCIDLTSDRPNKNGGLSYQKKYTHDLNIKLVHDYYKNEYNIILPKDTKVIFGAGTTMMIISLYYALQKKLKKNITISTNTKVFYTLHKKLAELLKNIIWTDINSTADLAVIVSPSNPLGKLTNIKDIKQKYILYDLVYDRALFTGKFETVNKDLYDEFNVNKKIFITNSFSKLGIPGVRCGFLITRDKKIADYCNEYIDIVSIKYPTASIAIGRIAYYKYFKNHEWNLKYNIIINKRRIQFIELSKKHNIKILNDTFLIPFIYTNKSVNWWIKNFNIKTRCGSDFNDTKKNSRLNLMLSNDSWKEFIKRFSK